MKKKILLPVLLVLVALGMAVAWVMLNYCVINSRLYQKNAEILDLRGQAVSIELYEKIREKLPGCEISWDVPFQEGTIPNDAESLTLTELSQEDLAVLQYFPKLKTVDATACTDLTLLPLLCGERAEVTVLFNLSVDGQNCNQETTALELSSITDAELALLDCMKSLAAITVTEGGNESQLHRLRDYCEARGIDFQVAVGGRILTKADKDLTIANVTDNQIKLLRLMPWLETLYLPEPEAKAQLLISLDEKLPQTKITWEKTVLGLTFDRDVEAIDLTPVIALGEGEVLGDKTAYDYGLLHPVLGTEEEDRCSIQVLKWHPLPDKSADTETLIAEVEAAMEYFPKAQYLRMCGAWLRNEAMAEFREAHREDYKVAWSVQCGRLATRTDATFFMPTKYHVYYFNDVDAYNLRYCEEITCIDLGHMNITDVSFVKYMPELKYLILTLSKVKSLEPVASCQKLIFLEMHWASGVKDYSPLLECKALEDLNIGRTYGDLTPVCQMTWLKNLWIVGCLDGSYRKASAALPDTNIGCFYDNPDDGWRQLPNYFAMRDALMMFYMK